MPKRNRAYLWKPLLIFVVFALIGSCDKGEKHSSIDQPNSEEERDASDDEKDTEIFINFDDERLQYEGRIDLKKEVGYLFWPGTTVRIKFFGEQLRVIMEDDKINMDQYANYFNIIIDGEVSGRLKLEREKKKYLIAENLTEGEHTVELFKLNSMHPSYPRGYAKLYGFEIRNGDILSPPALKKRKMEFYGNSITCGYGNEHEIGADNSSRYENNYMAYGAITARYFDAQYYCIARSGITLTKVNSGFNMPEMYNLLNPFYNNVRWDFSKYVPDIVVLNILQNDASLVPDEPAVTVKENYKKFIRSLRSEYPETYIICTLGPMNAIVKPKWPQIISEAVEELNDSKIKVLFFDYLERSGHPRISDDQKMANKLTSFIEENVSW